MSNAFVKNDSAIGNDTKTRTISITSGKGGVGKSTIVSNLAVHLSRQGKKVLILDGDMGMANIDVFFGVKAQRSIYDVIRGHRSLQEILVEVSENVFLIPGGSGVYELQNLSILERHVLIEQVQDLDHRFDYMLIDTAPGIDDSVLYLNSAAQDICVVVTPDPASWTDAYALIKVLNHRHHETRFSIVCNMARDEREALSVFRRLSDVASQFLCVSLDWKGFIPIDPVLRKATKSQQLILNLEPRSPSGFALRTLGEKLSHHGHIDNVKGGIQFFWQQMSGVA